MSETSNTSNTPTHDLPASWLVASNRKKFKADEAFAARTRVDWSESSSAHIDVGDTIFLYGSTPVSALAHECVVEQVGIPFDERIEDLEFWEDQDALLERKERSWMRLRLVRTFTKQEREALSLVAMKLHGLNAAPQSRMRLPGSLANLISRVSASVDNFWWVNQGGTAARGQDFQHLWAPHIAADGRRMRHWDSLDGAKVGDVVVHYSHGHVIGSSQVQKASAPVVRPTDFETGTLRGDAGREVWLHQFREFEVPVALEEIPLELRKDDLGEGSPFEHSGKVQQGFFFPVVQPIAAAIFESAGLLEGASASSGEFAATSAIDPNAERLLRMNGTDGVAIVTYRKEQSGLRALLFGNQPTARCGICSRQYPVGFLHTSHIKSRSACTLEERVDWKNIVMPACLFGCDALFEKSILRVGDYGVIQLQGNYSETPSLAAFAKSLEGKVAPAFTPENQRYFEWRNSRHV